MLKRNPINLKLIAIFLILWMSSTSQTTHSVESIKADRLEGNLSNTQITRNIASLPLAFTLNQGQWDDKVMFRANAGGATMWFSTDGAYYQFSRRIGSENNGPYSIVDKRSRMAPDMVDRGPDSIEIMMIKASFVGANSNPRMVGMDMMEYKCNYFIGNDPNEWHTDVPNYSAVMYEEIYDGIDLKYYGSGKQMEYDFIVEPGADFSQIKIQYEGAESISTNDNGELVVTTKWGEVVEQRPVIYQVENNSRISVDGKYLILSDNSFGFELNSYNQALPLVIDPVLSYSTYLGGNGFDEGHDIAVDASGSAYVTGETQSTNFPTLDPWQGAILGVRNAFVTKFSSSGTRLIYSTYLGGSFNDDGWGIAVDSTEAVYITGTTWSSDFPTLNPFQGTNQGGNGDVFVAKLSGSGDSLIYSTYLGGEKGEEGIGIAIDASGAAYITGHTTSNNFPTFNPLQATRQGYSDAFVTKLSSSGAGLMYSTYLGGVRGDVAIDIAVDIYGVAYVTGFTGSTDFPTLNPYQGTLHETLHDSRLDSTDVFVTKLDSSGESLIYSTYIGGNGNDRAYGIAVDAVGAAYITGKTESTDFPTLNSYQETLIGTYSGAHDAFISKLSSSGDSLIYSTYLGGNNGEAGTGIAVDATGSAYVTGTTTSFDFPAVRLFPIPISFQSGLQVFVTKLSSSGDSPDYSVSFGGVPGAEASDIAIDYYGAAYVTGRAFGHEFPTLNPYQGSHHGGETDAFVAKLTMDPPGCCDLGGDVNKSGTISISDATFIIAYLFSEESTPVCPNEGDADGSNSINISDAAYIISYIFSGGPVPVCGTMGT